MVEGTLYAGTCVGPGDSMSERWLPQMAFSRPLTIGPDSS